MIYNPELDGITHVNIYSKGKTDLGRFLTNFAHTPITLSEGTFQSIEGYWYWLGSHDDRLKALHGFEAKQFGRLCNRNYRLTEDNFQRKIKIAISVKMAHWPVYLRELQMLKIPLAHYYVFGNSVKPAGFEWLVAYFESMKK